MDELSRREFNKGALALLLVAGCATATERKVLDDASLSKLGVFSPTRAAKDGLEGVVLGVPFGSTNKVSRSVASRIGDISGAGLVIAEGFYKNHKIRVSSPTRGDEYFPNRIVDSQSRGIFHAYGDKATAMANGIPFLYIEFLWHSNPVLGIKTSGISLDEAKFISRTYESALAKLSSNNAESLRTISIEPIDRLPLSQYFIHHHGTGLAFKKHLILELPDIDDQRYIASCSNLLADLIKATVPHLKSGTDENLKPMRQIHGVPMPLGKLEYIEPSTGMYKDVVIGAPHGTSDWPTAELVRDASLDTGLGAVIVKGNTKYQSGDNRINVNRPTEGAVQFARDEAWTTRAKKAYDIFEEHLKRVAGGRLEDYIEIHSNSNPRTNDVIEIATVGISYKQALRIKEILKQAIAKNVSGNLPPLDVYIEPADSLRVWVAYAAKNWGSLRLAKRGVHIELPTPINSITRTYSGYGPVLKEAIPEVASVMRKS